MKQYYDTLKFILNYGVEKGDRTGTGAISYGFPPDQTFWMEDGFPLQWLKKTWFKGVVHERLWFVGALPDEYKKFGNTNIKYLVDHGVHIWDEWAYEKYKDYVESNWTGKPMSQEDFIERIKNEDDFAKQWGELGPVYGKQFRRWGDESATPFSYSMGIDQVQNIVDKLQINPDSRRMLINLWNVGELEQMALPPCHTVPVQFWSRPMSTDELRDSLPQSLISQDVKDLTDGQVNELIDGLNMPKRALSSRMYQRSADMGLGYPFNVASDALFLHMIAQVTNHVPERFVHSMGDAHIYLNHVDGMKEVLRRWEEEEHYKLPTISIDPDVETIEEFRFDSFKLNDYTSHDKIELPIAV